jgi:hypothetical protein
VPMERGRDFVKEAMETVLIQEFGGLTGVSKTKMLILHITGTIPSLASLLTPPFLPQVPTVPTSTWLTCLVWSRLMSVVSLRT